MLAGPLWAPTRWHVLLQGSGQCRKVCGLLTKLSSCYLPFLLCGRKARTPLTFETQLVNSCSDACAYFFRRADKQNVDINFRLVVDCAPCSAETEAGYRSLQVSAWTLILPVSPMPSPKRRLPACRQNGADSLLLCIYNPQLLLPLLRASSLSCSLPPVLPD